MSLIVLNSKGSDPEDFSNFMTEQIKFPKDAEVCLVSSNINRKLLVTQEAVIAAGSNSIGFQLGHGTLLADSTRNLDLYTAHSPLEVNIETKGKNFPIVAQGAAIGDEINAHFNDPDKINISNVARGWASAAAGANPFTFWNTPIVPEPRYDGSPGIYVTGTPGDWVCIPGTNNLTRGGVNSTNQIGGEIQDEIGNADYEMWAKLKGTNGNGNFVCNRPLWNTHNGARLGTFNQTTSNINIESGGWNWMLRSDNTTPEDVMACRGGIFDNAIFTSQNYFDLNSNINKLNGGTAYTVWWEITRAAADGSCEINWYARRPGRKEVRGTNWSAPAQPYFNWARAAVPAHGTEHIRIGMRPVIDATGASPVYCLEAYWATSVLATNVISGARPFVAATGAGLPGKIIISDPLNPATFADDSGGGDRWSFDLYRHLPLRMGCSSSATEPRILCNAIFHDMEEIADMGAPDQANFSPYTFLLGDLSPLQNALPENQGGSWDAGCRQILRKSTLGSSLGYLSHYGKVATVAMPPAAAGLPADLDLGVAFPENLNLVVTLPDLPITGYYGNSSGDGSSGTLNLNSGGNSAAIIGVIPIGNEPFKQEDGATINGHRGEFFACPMENWICLNNPTPFSISQLRCRITDALGNKPDILQSTSTITIKIKKRGRDEDFRQGGMNGVYPA